MNTLNPHMEHDMNRTSQTDTSFFVLVTSTLATIVSLAAVWAATGLGHVAGV